MKTANAVFADAFLFYVLAASRWAACLYGIITSYGFTFEYLVRDSIYTQAIQEPRARLLKKYALPDFIAHRLFCSGIH